jgi:hypothetical protein
MRDNLRLYRKMLTAMQGFLPGERITRLRNLALCAEISARASGLFLAESVHLGKVARKSPFAGKLVSLTNRLRRFLKNPRVEAARLYRPLARRLLSSFEGSWQEVRLIAEGFLGLDTTKVGFGHRVMTVSLAYRKRALPLCWTIHKGRKGHTLAEAQIRLLRRLKPLLPAQGPVSVMGDSEFGNVKLLRWLARQGFGYVLRTSGQSKIHLPRSSSEGAWIGLFVVLLR